MSKLTIAVLTDLHCDGSPRQSARMHRALQVLQNRAENGIDVLLMAGDYTYTGSRPEAETFRDTLVGCIDPQRTAIVPACGNHDTCWTGCMAADGWNAVWQPVLTKLAPDSDGEHGNWHVECGGYHFLTIEPYTYSPNLFTEHTAQWLRDTLTALTAADSTRYIFIATHGAADGTGVYGADVALDGAIASWGNSPTLYDMLRDFPQVVLFTGHTHYSLENERSIMQRHFTAVNAGGVTDIGCIWSTDAAGWLNSGFAENQSHGLLLTVEDGAVTMERLDLMRGRVMGVWQLPAPSADGSHLRIYRDDRDPHTAPDFGEGDITLTAVGRDYVHIEHPVAVGKSQTLAYHYTVQKDGEESRFHLFSQWSKETVFSHDVYRALPKPPFTLTVTAQDIWGNCGAPKTVQVDAIPVSGCQPVHLPDEVPCVEQGPLTAISVMYDNIAVTGDAPHIDLLFACDGVPQGYDGGQCAIVRYDPVGGRIVCHPHDAGVVLLQHPALQHENACRITLRFYEDDCGGLHLRVAVPGEQFDAELPNFFFWAKKLTGLSHVYTAVQAQDVTFD